MVHASACMCDILTNNMCFLGSVNLCLCLEQSQPYLQETTKVIRESIVTRQPYDNIKDKEKIDLLVYCCYLKIVTDTIKASAETASDSFTVDYTVSHIRYFEICSGQLCRRSSYEAIPPWIW